MRGRAVGRGIVLLAISIVFLSAPRASRAASEAAGSAPPATQYCDRDTPRGDIHTGREQPKDRWNGICVDSPKIYDNRTLELQLVALTGRLSQITGIDQNTLIAHIGALQGANSTQIAGSLQIMGPPIPSVGTVAATGTPSAVATQVPGATPGLFTTTGQTVTTPSSTTQTTTTNAAIAPAVPGLPASSSVTLPSAYNVSSVDALNEMMQLSSQLMQTQIALEGSPADTYTLTGQVRRRVTLGFPISVETPLEYLGDAAEVEVAVCNPINRTEDEAPTLVNILPAEKTYNVAGITSASVGLGAGGVIGGVLSVGGSFLWGHQTYFVVRQQDTIALRHPRGEQSAQFDTCPAISGGATPPIPLKFAWQFRPVLGRKTIDQGLRETLAQVSLAPGDIMPGDTTQVQIMVRTCWRKYNPKTGIVDGGTIDRSCRTNTFDRVPIIQIPGLRTVAQIDNGDGTASVTVTGTFPLGTKVFLGDNFLTDGSTGFLNNGDFVKFTAPYQVLAIRGARLLLPDGTLIDVQQNQDVVGPVVQALVTQTATISGAFQDGTRLLFDDKPLAGVTIDQVGIHFPAPPGSAGFKGLVVVRPDGSKVEAAKLAPVTTTDDPQVITVLGQFDHNTKFTLDGVPVTGVSFDLNHARFLLPVGKDLRTLVVHRPDRATCEMPNTRQAWPGASVTPYNDGLVLLTIDVSAYCVDIGPKGDYPLYLVLAGKAYGLPDAPFRDNEPGKISVLVPKAALQGQETVFVKRLFFGKQYTVSYALADWDPASSPNLALVQSDGKNLTFAITGVQLKGTSIVIPNKVVAFNPISETLMTFTLTNAAAKSLKLVALMNQKGETTTLTMPDLPSAKGAAEATAKLKLTAGLTIPLGATTAVTIAGTNLQLIASVRYSGGRLDWNVSPDKKSLVLQAPLPAGLVSSAGSHPLAVTLTDKSVTTYVVIVK